THTNTHTNSATLILCPDQRVSCFHGFHLFSPVHGLLRCLYITAITHHTRTHTHSHTRPHTHAHTHTLTHTHTLKHTFPRAATPNKTLSPHLASCVHMQ